MARQGLENEVVGSGTREAFMAAAQLAGRLAWRRRAGAAQVLATLAQAEATMVLAAEQKRIADWLEALPLANDGSPVVSPNAIY